MLTSYLTVDQLRWQLNLILSKFRSVSDLYTDILTFFNGEEPFHLSTFNRVLQGQINLSKKNILQIMRYLDYKLPLEEVLNTFYSLDIIQAGPRKRLLYLYNSYATMEILCQKLREKIKDIPIDYILTFPEAVPFACLLGPKYLGVNYTALLPYKPTNEPFILVDYKVESALVRSYYLVSNDIKPGKKFGVILDFIEYGNLGRIFFELVRNPEVKGEIKFLIIIIGIGVTWKKRFESDLSDLPTFVLYQI